VFWGSLDERKPFSERREAFGEQSPWHVGLAVCGFTPLGYI